MTTNEEKNFEQYVNSLRFDDAPSKAHQEKLEKQLLEAYDYQQKYGGYVEPVSIYLKKVAIAAGFLIICGMLFWGIEKQFIEQPIDSFVDNHPDREQLEYIIKEQQAAGADKKSVLAQMSDIWKKIKDQDATALVSILQTDDIACNLRVWAAEYLGKFGNEHTLTMLDNAIMTLGVTDPNDPLMVAASEIRKRLNLASPKLLPQTKPVEMPSLMPLEENSPQTDDESIK